MTVTDRIRPIHAVNYSVDGARNIWHELHRAEAGLGQRAICTHLDRGEQALAELLVGDRPQHGVCYVGVAGDHGGDGAGVHVLSTGDDHVVDPAVQQEPAHQVEVAGWEGRASAVDDPQSYASR